MPTTNKRIVGGLPALTLASTMPSSAAPAPGADIVTSGPTSGWPDGTGARSFIIKIDAEAILVSARSANSLTVEQRGYDGTTAVAHQAGVSVYCAVVDATSLQAYEDHIVDTSAAHAAAAISFTPAGSVAATNVQAAVQEVSADVTAEAGQRNSADAALQVAIDNLVAALGSLAGAGTSAAAVAANLVIEQAARAAADTALGARIDTHEAASVAWTPTITGWVLNNGTLDCWKRIAGKWCDYDFKLTVGSTTSFGSKLKVAPPAPAKRTDRSNVTQGAAIRNSDGFNEPLAVDLVSGNFEPNTMISAVQIQAAVGLTGASPWTWHIGDVVAFSGRVELA